MQALSKQLRSGSRRALAKALTLTESTKPEHKVLAMQLLDLLAQPATAAAASTSSPAPPECFRVGITGPPGAGKSTLIEALGCALVEGQGERVAVLAVDPSSETSGGAILGDKTRMTRLSSLDAAFVRPSPSRGTLGGVTRSTVEAATLCGAAGYTTLLIETVGVGQSETAVADLVDCLVLVLPPVGGDDLQAIKRGVTELADIVVVNKADGATKTAAMHAAAAFRATASLRPPRRRSWKPAVLRASAATGVGMDALQDTLARYLETMRESGELKTLRERQRTRVAWSAAGEEVVDRFHTAPAVVKARERIEEGVKSGRIGPRSAAMRLADCFVGSGGGGGTQGADDYDRG